MAQHVPVKWSALTFPLFSFPCLPLTPSSSPPSLCLEVDELNANVDPQCYFTLMLFLSRTEQDAGDSPRATTTFFFWPSALIHVCHTLPSECLRFEFMFNETAVEQTSANWILWLYSKWDNEKKVKVNNSRQCHWRWWAFNDAEPSSHLSRATQIKETTNSELKWWRN